MRAIRVLLCGVVLALLCLPAAARTAARFGLPRDVALPSPVTLDVYVPASVLDGRVFVREPGYYVPSGAEVRAAVDDALKTFVTDGRIVDLATPRPTGLLLVLHPKLTFEGGTARQTLRWKLFGPGGAVLLQGERVGLEDVAGVGIGDAVREATTDALRPVFVEILGSLRPDATRYPPTLAFASVAPAAIVEHDAAISTGTGFYVNADGHVLTAAHVLRDCMLVEAKRNGVVLTASTKARSDLLDLAVVATGQPAPRHLPFRAGDLVLGEPVTNVGFPLQSLLAATPNLTRGNVSSRGALTGAVGQFQFSAPIQPGSSGGPVVSDGGEVLGITVSTLKVSRLIESGALPQNVNFALEARYAAMFLRKHGIAFDERPAPSNGRMQANGSMQVANEAALSTVVSLSCYQ